MPLSIIAVPLNLLAIGAFDLSFCLSSLLILYRTLGSVDMFALPINFFFFPKVEIYLFFLARLQQEAKPVYDVNIQY